MIRNVIVHKFVRMNKCKHLNLMPGICEQTLFYVSLFVALSWKCYV